MIAVNLQNESHLMEASTFSDVTTNLSDDESIFYLQTGTTGHSRVKAYSVWDDEW